MNQPTNTNSDACEEIEKFLMSALTLVKDKPQTSDDWSWIVGDIRTLTRLVDIQLTEALKREEESDSTQN